MTSEIGKNTSELVKKSNDTKFVPTNNPNEDANVLRSTFRDAGNTFILFIDI